MISPTPLESFTQLNKRHSLGNMEPFKKEYYLELVKTLGHREAVNQLHQDLWQLEKTCFDGTQGYQPEAWTKLNEMRLFSRELWDEVKGNPTPRA